MIHACAMVMDNLDLKKSALLGAFWKFAERIGAQLVSLVVSVVLARLLTPDDYSVVGITTVFFSFCNVFITGGFNSALIRKKDADDTDYSSVFHISVWIAVAMYVGLFFAAPAIAQLYKKPILIPAFRVMGITLVINAIKSVVCAYISNKLQFRKFFFATLGGTLISAVVGVWMALKGFGPWALIAQNMTNSLIDTLILFATTKLRILLVVSWKRLKELFNYGWKIFVASVITVIYEESNAFIIGLKFTTTDLSFYTKGRSYPAMLNTAINGTLSAVLFPVMSKVQDDADAVLNYTRRFIRVASFLIFPIMIGFMAVSDNFIRLLLTEKWMPAAPYIKIFCISYMFNLIQQGNLQTIRAIGRSDIILKLEIIKKSLYLLVTIGALILSRTPEALAATALINTLIATITNSAPNKKLIGYGFKQQLCDILPSLVASVVMGGTVCAIGYISLPIWLTLIVQIISGMAVYVVINVIIKNPDLVYMWKTLKGCFRKNGR